MVTPHHFSADLRSGDSCHPRLYTFLLMSLQAFKLDCRVCVIPCVVERPIKSLDDSVISILPAQEIYNSGKMNGSGCVFDHYGRVPEGIYKVDSFNSPLEEAVYNRDVEKFKELIKEGHKVTVRLRVGQMSCIEFSAMMGYTDMLRLLIESSPNAKILREYFSLDDVVDRAYMISRNKDIFFDQEALAEANRYEAALFTSVEYNQPDSVYTMLEYLGPREPGRHSFVVKDNNQKSLSATELAQVRGHEECFEILKKHSETSV